MTRFAGALGVLLATLLGLLVGTPPALAVVPTTTVQWYAYDSPNRTSQTNDITPERSLPAKSHACAATLVAGDHASDGGARADALVAYGYTASDAHAVTAHGDNAAGTTSRLVQVIDGESSALARAGVAANGVDEAGALVRYDPMAASRNLLGQVGEGYAVTPGGRTISAHAAERIALGGPGRPPTTLGRVDDILNNPTGMKYDPIRDTVKVMQGKDFVVVSGTGPQHIVTVMVR